jgi:hypothetical protein
MDRFIARWGTAFQAKSVLSMMRAGRVSSVCRRDERVIDEDVACVCSGNPLGRPVTAPGWHSRSKNGVASLACLGSRSTLRR